MQDIGTQYKSAVENTNYYRADIDGLRGVAVSLVILYHLFPRALPNGYLGVDIFFVISGFVVTQSLQRDLSIGVGNGLLGFYSHRVKRILPALYFNLAVTIVLTALFIPPSDWSSIFKTAAAAAAGVSNLALLFARFDYFHPDLTLNPFVQTWSLGAEEQFYLAFPLLLICGMKVRKPAGRHSLLLPLLATGSLSYWIYLQFTSPVTAFYNPLARFWEILAGAILFLNRDAISIIKGGRSWLQYAAIGSLAAALWLPSDSTFLTHFANVFAVLGTLVLVGGGAPNSGVTRFLSTSVLMWTGRMSYSLYLWHYPILTFARWNLDLDQPYVVFVLVLLIAGCATLSYRYIELPFRYASPKGTPVIFCGVVAAVACVALICSLYLTPPSRIYLGNALQYANLWPADKAPLAASLHASWRQCHLEYGDQMPEGLFEKCSTFHQAGHFIYLVGNSHAQQLVPMLESTYQDLGYGYSAVTISNCRMTSSVQVIRSMNYRFDLCQQYFDRTVDYISENATRGDIVLIGDRSLFDKPDSASAGQASTILIGNGLQLSADEAYTKSIDDISSLARLLLSRGVDLVLEGPTPQFNVHATVCGFEWFRMARPDCKEPIQAVIEDRTPYLQAISQAVATNRNIYLWDPLFALCHKEYCAPSDGNKLLYRDQQHLSVYGAQTLAPSFEDFLIKTLPEG